MELIDLSEFNLMEPSERLDAFRILTSNLKTVMKEMEESIDKYEMQELEGSRKTNHVFGEGFYLRDMVIPANMYLVTEIHVTENPLFLMSGKCDIITEDGVQNIEAPWYGITKPGTQRVIYTHELCNFITVHPVEAKTVKEAEEACIAKDFNDPRIGAYNNLKQLKE